MSEIFIGSAIPLPTPAKVELVKQMTRFSNPHRNALPTKTELRIAMGDLTAEEAANLVENSQEPFDPDVVGVLTGVYTDREDSINQKFLEEVYTEPVKPWMCAFATGAAAVFAMLATKDLSKGEIGHGVFRAGLSALFAGEAYFLNYLSKGTNGKQLLDYLRRHCPPVYSPSAMREETQNAFEAGQLAATIFSRVNIDPNLEFGQQENTNTGMMVDGNSLAQRVTEIVTNWRNGTSLSPNDMRTLQLAKAVVTGMNIRPNDFCPDGQSIISDLDKIIQNPPENQEGLEFKE